MPVVLDKVLQQEDDLAAATGLKVFIADGVVVDIDLQAFARPK